MEKEQALHPAGLGYPDRILKPHFCVVSFKAFCKFQEIYFLIIFSSLLGVKPEENEADVRSKAFPVPPLDHRPANLR